MLQHYCCSVSFLSIDKIVASKAWQGYAHGCSVLIFSVADVDAKERVDDSLVEILKLRFGRDFEPEFWSQY